MVILNTRSSASAEEPRDALSHLPSKI